VAIPPSNGKGEKGVTFPVLSKRKKGGKVTGPCKISKKVFFLLRTVGGSSSTFSTPKKGVRVTAVELIISGEESLQERWGRLERKREKPLCGLIYLAGEGQGKKG